MKEKQKKKQKKKLEISDIIPIFAPSERMF
jgi:hypothetical protein